MKTPKGVVCLLIHPQGYVCALGSSFRNRMRMGSDELKAREDLCEQYLQQYVNSDFAQFLNRTEVERALFQMANSRSGYKIKYVEIGDESDEQD